jgi:DNA polymerase-1
MTQALIDTEYFLYRCAAGAEQEANWGDDNWTYVCRHDDARAAFEEQIADILGQLIGYQPVLVFGDKHSFRYGVWPQYKANRKKMRKPAGYSALTEWVMTMAAARGWDIARFPQVEGDDALGILHNEGDVIVSQDKDMLTLPGQHFRDGELTTITRRDADMAFYCQTLTGDTSDNYPGCPKFGPVTARKLLAGCMDEPEMWRQTLAAYEKAGFNERYAITMARCARILRSGEYDHEQGIPILWNPPVT